MPAVKCPFCHEEKIVNHDLNVHYTDENGEKTVMSRPIMWRHCVSKKCFRKHFVRLEGRFDANFPEMLRKIKNHFNHLKANSSTLAKMVAAKKSAAGIWWSIIMGTRSTELAVKVMTAMSHGRMEEVADEIDDDLMEDITASKMIGWFRPRHRSRTTPETTTTNVAPSTTNSTTTEVRLQSVTGSIRETYPTRTEIKEMNDAAATAPLLARIAELEAANAPLLARIAELEAANAPLIAEPEALKKQKKSVKLVLKLDVDTATAAQLLACMTDL